jgi:hypothetical protein
VGVTKQPPQQHEDGEWWVWADLQHKMCSGGGRNETIHPGHIRIDLINNWEGGGWPGDTTINWVEGDGAGKHNNYFDFEPGANSRPSTACLAPKHNNKQQSSSFVVVNERKARPFATDVQNKQQSAEEGGGKFDCCLVFISCYSNNTYYKKKLHQ